MRSSPFLHTIGRTPPLSLFSCCRCGAMLPHPHPNIFLVLFLWLKMFLLAGKRCVQVIAHYNPFRVRALRGGGCTPLDPAYSLNNNNNEATNIYPCAAPSRGGSEQHNKREKNSTTFVPNSPTSTSIGRKTHRRIDLKTSSRDTLKSTGQKMQSKATRYVKRSWSLSPKLQWKI